jgi:hypothetical protein
LPAAGVFDQFIEPALPGDYNGDGIVDAADYLVWRKTLGSTSDMRANGDDTGNSTDVIDQADLVFWKARFGNSFAVGARSALASMPEPTTAVPWLAGFAMLFQTLRRRKAARAM